MSYCPECKGEMGAAEIVCPHCGYDFPAPPTDANSRKDGIAYSFLADIALTISMIAAGVGCFVAFTVAIVSLLRGDLIAALVVAPIAFFLQLGMLVVFLRVQNI
ncbi:MAG: hypothetical protein JWN70_6498 [Planctomycetaceae bacterium]|nr:hypothetical protein [Planctomycetaceae bacterium]